MKQRPRVYAAACILAALLAFSCAAAIRPGPMEDLAAEQVKARIEAGGGLVVVDTRTEYEYSQGHLPGSISIPPYKFNMFSTLLPPDKGVEVVFYCRGYG